MVHLVQFHNKMKHNFILKYLLVSTLFYACNSNNNINKNISVNNSANSVLAIPKVYTNALQEGFTLHADTIFLNNKKYSGIIYKLNNKDTVFVGSYFNGIEEGVHKKWYSKKQISEIRYYHLGKKEGKHTGYWENGNPKFEFYFMNGEHHGIAKEWYKNGNPYRTFHYENGYEAGSQKMWWENGTIKANYVVKNGRRFGLIGLKLCMNQNDTLTSTSVKKL